MNNFSRATAAALIGYGIAGGGAASAAVTILSDPILFWNDRAITQTVPLPGGAPGQTRAYAMMNIAMHDAVNAALGGPRKSFLTGVAAPGGDTRAAASQAARNVLVALDPANTGLYDTALVASLAQVADGPAKTNGIATGAAYAAAVVANRTGDGSTPAGTYTTTGLAGDWRPTSAGNPAAPQWAGVTPFVMSSVDQFRPGAPPALTSAEYKVAYDEVKQIGSATSEAMGFRTPDQTAAALFWDNAAGAPWLRIGVIVAEDEGLSTIDNARVFATLTTGLADAIIGGFDAKYHYRLWRPLTAIREGNADGNPLTDGDAGWTSLFGAPLHPSFVSTHAALSGAGSTILKSFFGDDEAFTFTIATDTRSFSGVNGLGQLEQAAVDGANSRLWGGIHFRFDNDAGLALGRQIGQRAISGANFGAIPEPATWAMMVAGFGLIGSAMRRRATKASYATA